jgi:predicted nucleic acid-binding protein
MSVLIDAKENQHIEAIRPHLDPLQQEAGFWISEALYRRVLRDEGELS